MPIRIVDPTRKKRENLLDEIRDEINAVASAYGVEVRALRLNNFALDIRTIGEVHHAILGATKDDHVDVP